MKQIGIKLLCAIANKINEKNNYPLPLPIAENISLKLKFIYSQEDEEYFYKYEIENSYKGLNKSCKKLLLKSKDNYDPKSEKNIILSDKGVYFYNVNVVIFMEWAKMNNYNLIENDNYIGFSSRNSVMFWIPTHAFNSLKEKDEFFHCTTVGVK